jgi:glycosyltransferase involved in cell wall biosynthesis
MRILVINTVPFMKNGISQMIVNYGTEINSKTANWDVLANETISADYKEALTDAGAKVILTPSRKKKPVQYLRALASVIRSNKYDGIYIHCNSSMVALDLRFIRLFFHGTIFIHAHGVTTNYPHVERMLRGLMPKTRIVNLAASLEAGEWLFHGKKFTVVPNAIDYERYIFDQTKRIEVRTKLNIEEHQILLLQVGVFNEQKNQMFSVDLLRKMYNHRRFKLLFVGDGKNKEYVVEKAHQWQLDELIRFLPPSEDMQALYSAADVLLFPSIFEPFGMVAIEAQANGLPIFESEHVPDVTGVVDGLSTKIQLSQPDEWLSAIERSEVRDGKTIDKRLIARDFDTSNFEIQSAAKKLAEFMETEVNKY